MPSLTVPFSGMQAAATRLSAVGSNVANINSNGALPGTAGPQAYQPVRVQQTSGADGITSATVTNVSPSYVTQYDPSAPYADSQGMVAAPNVDLLNEFLNLTLATNDFLANAKVGQATSDMLKQLYEMGSG